MERPAESVAEILPSRTRKHWARKHKKCPGALEFSTAVLSESQLEKLTCWLDSSDRKHVSDRLALHSEISSLHLDFE